MLTRKQIELLDFMREYSEPDGVMPSYEEMMLAMGLKSKSGIHRLITALERRGEIIRRPNEARAIRLVERLPNAKPTSTALHQIEGVCRDASKGYLSKTKAIARIQEIAVMNMGGV